MISNWLAVAPLIAAQLVAIDEVSNLRIVSGIPEAQALAKENFELFVAWGGDQPKDSAGQGSVVSVYQRWAVILTAAPGQDAGPLMSQVLKALTGVKLSEESQEFHYAGSSAGLFDGRFLYFPMYFTTQVFIS